MTSEEISALEELRIAVDRLADKVVAVQREQANAAENQNRLAGKFAVYEEQARANDERTRRTSDRAHDARRSASEVDGGLRELSAVVVSQVARIEDGNRQHRAEVRAELDAIRQGVVGVTYKTDAQTETLDKQSVELDAQTTMLARLKPTRTAVAAFVGTAATSGIIELLRHFGH